MKTRSTSKGKKAATTTSVRRRTVQKVSIEATKRCLPLRACRKKYSKASASHTAIFTLPSEIFSVVCLFIDFKTATSLAHTCKVMRQVIYPYLNSIVLQDIESKDPILISSTPAVTLQRYKALATLTQRAQRYDCNNGRYRLSLLSWIHFRRTEVRLQVHLKKLSETVTKMNADLHNMGSGNISEDVRAGMVTVRDNFPFKMKQRIDQLREDTFTHIEQMCGHVPGDFEREEF